MSRNTKKQQMDPHHDHGPPITRRDFISRGLITGGGLMLAPSLLSILLKSEMAEAALTCSSGSSAPGLIPFLSIDCAGGASLSGNAVVGSQASGALVPLTSYGKLGLSYNPATTPGSIDTRFGAGFHAGPSPADSTKVISKIFEGILATASATTQANTRIVTICHSAQDDSQNNELNPVVSVAKAGLAGTYYRSGMGTSNSTSGGNSAPSLADGSLQPMYASSVSSVIGALSYGTKLGAYTTAQKTEMAKAISSLSQSQATRFAALSPGDQFQQLVNCGFISNQSLAAAAPAVDPRTNAVMQAIYGITTTSNDSNALNAAVVYNVLMGNSGPGTISASGCDYHNQKPPGDVDHGDNVDLKIGQLIGRAIEAAAQLGKPLFISVFSDGSVISNPDTRVWVSDNGSASLALLVLYKPAGLPANKNSQIGSYTSGQTASRTPFFAASPKFTSYVMLANYLSVCGQLGSFSGMAPSGFPTDTATLNSIIGFG